jgi:hypothetical protein
MSSGAFIAKDYYDMKNTSSEGLFSEDFFTYASTNGRPVVK